MPTTKSDHHDKQRLPDLCAECLMLILQLRGTKEFGEAAVLRQRIKELLGRFESQAKDAGYEQSFIREKPMFALVAFLDEVILGSEWSSKESWFAFPLQMEYYNRFDAGDEFFNRLQELRQSTRQYADTIEVFYLCLALGFRGRYQFNPEKVSPIIEDVYHDLRRVTGKSVEPLSPHGKPRDQIRQVAKETVPVWVIGVAAAAVGLIFYVIVSVMVSNHADVVARQLAGGN
jgi:type VI secretion system protein ImpK